LWPNYGVQCLNLPDQTEVNDENPQNITRCAIGLNPEPPDYETGVLPSES